MRTKTGTVRICWTYLGMEMCAEADVTYHPGSPAVMYQRNGDPGWPAEPRELIDVLSCTLIEVGNAKVREDMDPSTLPADLVEKISDALADVEEYDPRDDRAYEEARDRKLEERWERT